MFILTAPADAGVPSIDMFEVGRKTRAGELPISEGNYVQSAGETGYNMY